MTVAVAVAVGRGLSSRDGTTGPPREPAPPGAIAKLSHISLASLTGSRPVSLAGGLNGATRESGQPLISGGKPQVLYIGAEFCPICAAERWPMFMALSKFGTFYNMSETHSALNDGNIATLSFYGSTYTSAYLTFTALETTTNQPAGNYYKPLETPSKAAQAVWSRYDGTNLGFPFIDIGGKWVLKGAEYTTDDLSGRTFAEIVNDVGNNNTKIGSEIDASAAVFTKYLCSVTGEQPANVCATVADVPLPRSAG